MSFESKFLPLIYLYLIQKIISNNEAKMISEIQQSIVETVPRVADFNIKSYLNSHILEFQLYQNSLYCHVV